MTDQIWTLSQGDTLHISGPATVTAQEIGNKRNRRAIVRVESPHEVTVTKTSGTAKAEANGEPLKESPAPSEADNNTEAS